MYDILRAQHDFGDQSRIGVAYTDRVVGGDYNRVADVDGRVAFGDVYNAIFQYAQSFDKTRDVARNAPLWTAAIARNGKQYGFRYFIDGIERRLSRAAAGSSRARGSCTASPTSGSRGSRSAGSKLEAITGDLNYDDTWQYSHFVRHGDAQDKKFHSSATAAFRGGWNVGARRVLGDVRLGLDALRATTGFERRRHDGRHAAVHRRRADLQPRLRVHARDAAVVGVQRDLLYVGGQDENFFEWAQANINLVTLTIERAAERSAFASTGRTRIRIIWRRTDGSLVGRNVIPRLKVEYQLTRSIFLRVVGEYDLSEHERSPRRDANELPAARQRLARARPRVRAQLRGDYLFSYTPRPGTVFFVGYGNAGSGRPDATRRFDFEPIHRSTDYFFLKYSYLFRM